MTTPTPTPFTRRTVDVIAMVHRAAAKAEQSDMLTTDPEVYSDLTACINQVLSQVVFQIRSPMTAFRSTDREAFDTLVKFVS